MFGLLRLTLHCSLAFLLLAGSAGADELIEDPEDPSESASAPVSTKKPPPALDSERIVDAEDPTADDDDSTEKNVVKSDDVSETHAPAQEASAGTEPAALWSARAQLRLALDIYNEREPAGAYKAYREDTLEFMLQTMARLEYRVRPWLRLKLGGRILYRLTNTRPTDTSTNEHEMVSERSHRNELEADFTDLSIGISSSYVDVKAGLLTVVWGTTDLANPNDVMAPRDLRLGLLTDPETSRLPVLTLALQTEVKEIGFTAYWQPMLVPHRVDLFGSDYALCGPAAPPSLQRLGEMVAQMVDDSVEGSLQASLLQTSLPKPFVDPILGARVTAPLGSWDIALQYGWLFERLPRFRVKPDGSVFPLLTGDPGDLTDAQLQQVASWLMQQPTPVEGVYRRHHHAGISLSGVIWQLAVNFDLAYQSRQAALLGGKTPLVPEGNGWFSASVDSQTVSYTLGLTYLRGERFVASIEWWHMMLVDLMGPTGQDLLFGRPQQGGLAGLLRYRLSSINLTFQLAAKSDLINPSVVICPQIAYRIGDHLGILAGANLFEGIYQSVIGKLGQNDQVYVGLEGYL